MNILEAHQATMAGKTVIGPNGEEYTDKNFSGNCTWSRRCFFGEWKLKPEPLKIYVNLYREGLSEVHSPSKDHAMIAATHRNYIRTITFVEET